MAAVQAISDACHQLDVADIDESQIEAVFADVESIYTGSAMSLDTHVEGLIDRHYYHHTGETIGTFMNDQIADAIEEGKSGELNQARAIDHCEIVRKLLDVYSYVATFDAMTKDTGQGLDEGYGCYGVALDGTTAVGGLAKVGQSRASEFDTDFNGRVVGLFADANTIVRDNTPNATTPVVEGSVFFLPVVHATDISMMQVIAASVIHEFYDLVEASHPVSEVIEARVYWWGLSPFAHAVDPVRATEIENLLYEGHPIPTWADLDYFHEGITGDPAQRAAFLEALQKEQITLLVTDFAFQHLELGLEDLAR
jgi:hypothetical protein